MSRNENLHRDNELDYSSFYGFHAQLDYKITNEPKKWGETLVGRNVVIYECFDCKHRRPKLQLWDDHLAQQPWRNYTSLYENIYDRSKK